jgi:ketosteroid isomerase-like protein
MNSDERLIRQGYDAWNRSDWSRLEQVLAPEFEVDASDRVLNPDHYAGLSGFRRLADELAEVWDTWEVEPVELVQSGDRTFVASSIRARGRGSGVEVVRTYWHVWTVRGGKATKLALYVDRDRALAAAGLSAG